MSNRGTMMIKKHKKKNEHKIKTENTKKSFKLKFTPSIYFISIAITLALGYLVGAYSYQIKSYVGLIFGYQKNPISIDLSSLEQTYSELASNYDGKLNIDKMIEGANKGLVRAIGDTHTVYMSADEASEYSDSLEGNIGGGIGALIGLKNDRVTIMSVLDDNPAIAAGLKGGDLILEINDQSTDGMSIDIAVSRIRGQEGTTVKLLVDRSGEELAFNVTRAIINNPSVISKIENGIGIMKISRFDESTGSLARIAANSFVKEGVSGVILDLRDNPGGYVNASVDVASLWLDNKVVVTERSGGIIIDSFKSRSGSVLADIKTVVLVNHNSASASEIVAGALQDYELAKVVGQKTYGKGSVQKLIKLKNGAELKVTIAKWYTPEGKNIASEGVMPDYVVNLTQDDVNNDSDPQLERAFEILEI
jgi:carboxyl-terminal processing protease